jgi:hypothetical protein
MLQPSVRSAGGITLAKQAVEMTAYGKPGKRYNRFPSFPQALEIKKRFPHYHRPDEYEN